jgi:hypothetical protein
MVQQLVISGFKQAFSMSGLLAHKLICGLLPAKYDCQQNLVFLALSFLKLLLKHRDEYVPSPKTIQQADRVTVTIHRWTNSVPGFLFAELCDTKTIDFTGMFYREVVSIY